MKHHKKVILITGAGKRLGRYLAEGLSEKYNIAIHYHRSKKEAMSLATHLNFCRKESTHIFQANMMSVRDIENMVKKIVRHFGRVDILINNASIFKTTPFGTISEEDWDQHMDTNLKGPFFCTQAVANWMLHQTEDKKHFKIINIADSGGPKTRAHYLPYWVSKSGLMAMTETLAKIFSPGIQVNTIAPGPILFSEDAEKLKQQLPIHPSEILKTVHYLLNTSAVTGNTLIIDQGRRYSI